MPIYLQIIEQVKFHVATGALKPHEELPSVRALATEQLVNPNTIARGYLELEREGLIYKKRGMGTYVAEQEVEMSAKEKMRIVGELLDKALVQAVQLGLDAELMRQVFEKRLKEFDKER